MRHRNDIHEPEESMHVTTQMGLRVMALAVALAVVAVPAVAQDQRADKKLLIAENLPLTAAEAKAFWPVDDSDQQELSALNDRMVTLIKEYANNYQTMSDQIAKRPMDEFLAIDASRLKIRQAYVPRFRKVPREKQVARYYQLENKVQAAMSYELAAEIPLVK
jgi:hypothetical protein